MQQLTEFGAEYGESVEKLIRERGDFLIVHKSIIDSSGHRGGASHGLVDAGKIVMHEMQRDR